MDTPLDHPNPGQPRAADRFDGICELMTGIARGGSDQRFGQLIVNALRTAGLNERDLFSIEDAALHDALVEANFR